MQINMVGIITSQLDTMVEFYRDVMGMTIITQMDNYVEFEQQGIRFALSTSQVMRTTTGHPSYDQKTQGQVLELAFLVHSAEEVDTTYQHLIANGATAVKDPEDKPWGQRAGFFADPDGNIHEIFANL